MDNMSGTVYRATIPTDWSTVVGGKSGTHYHYDPDEALWRTDDGRGYASGAVIVFNELYVTRLPDPLPKVGDVLSSSKIKRLRDSRVLAVVKDVLGQVVTKYPDTSEFDNSFHYPVTVLYIEEKSE